MPDCIKTFMTCAGRRYHVRHGKHEFANGGETALSNHTLVEQLGTPDINSDARFFAGSNGRESDIIVQGDDTESLESDDPDDASLANRTSLDSAMVWLGDRRRSRRESQQGTVPQVHVSTLSCSRSYLNLVPSTSGVASTGFSLLSPCDTMVRPTAVVNVAALASGSPHTCSHAMNQDGPSISGTRANPLPFTLPCLDCLFDLRTSVCTPESDVYVTSPSCLRATMTARPPTDGISPFLPTLKCHDGNGGIFFQDVSIYSSLKSPLLPSSHDGYTPGLHPPSRRRCDEYEDGEDDGEVPTVPCMEDSADDCGALAVSSSAVSLGALAFRPRAHDKDGFESLFCMRACDSLS